MQSLVTVIRPVYKNLETGFYKYLVVDNKPDLDYMKIVSTYRGKPTEMWMKVTSVEVYQDGRWMAWLTHEVPQIQEKTEFKLEENYDPEWF